MQSRNPSTALPSSARTTAPLILLVLTAIALALASCAPSIPLDQHNADISAANGQILSANATSAAAATTISALEQLASTAEVGLAEAGSTAEAAQADASSNRQRIRQLLSTITVLAPTPTPPCPEGQVATSDGACAVPTPTIAPTPTLTRAQQPKRSGIYLIGSEIAVGYWRGTSRGDGCYWATYTATGGIIDNHFGACSSIMLVPDWGTSVEINDGVYEYCGSSPATCPVVQ